MTQDVTLGDKPTPRPHPWVAGTGSGNPERDSRLRKWMVRWKEGCYTFLKVPNKMLFCKVIFRAIQVLSKKSKFGP